MLGPVYLHWDGLYKTYAFFDHLRIKMSCRQIPHFTPDGAGRLSVRPQITENNRKVALKLPKTIEHARSKSWEKGECPPS